MLLWSWLHWLCVAKKRASSISLQFVFNEQKWLCNGFYSRHARARVRMYACLCSLCLLLLRWMLGDCLSGPVVASPPPQQETWGSNPSVPSEKRARRRPRSRIAWTVAGRAFVDVLFLPRHCAGRAVLLWSWLHWLCVVKSQLCNFVIPL